MSSEQLCASNRADIIIVGAGCSGTYLASILSKYYSVILLEFGQQQIDNPLIDDPLNAPDLYDNETNLLFYPGGRERPTPNRSLINNLVTGTVLGGGSAVNGMKYVKGPATFYDRMACATMDSDYGECNAIRIYKDLETYNYTVAPSDPSQRGTDGPLDVRQGAVDLPVAQLFVNAANSILGVPITNDYNSMSADICADPYMQLTQTLDKEREYGYNAFLEPLVERPDCDSCQDCLLGNNLKVFTNVLVNKVLFDNFKNAIGVDAVARGVTTTFMASVQVILCAGFQSPLILQRSGVGPAQVLADNNITPVSVNENVGANILNHPVLTVTGTGDIGYVPTDAEALYTGVVFTGDSSSSQPEARGFQIVGFASPGAFTLKAFILNAKSKGRTYVYGINPNHGAALEFNYFTDGPDIYSAITVVKQMVKILQEMGLTPVDPPLTPAQIIATYTQSYNWVGGCRISPCQEGGVVNSNCQVYGVTNLMVVDSSAIPINCLGNTQAPSYWLAGVIGDKIARGRGCAPPCAPTPDLRGMSTPDSRDIDMGRRDSLMSARPCAGCNKRT